MSRQISSPERARQFAVEVVIRLRESGHEALWAGGCVRDELLGRIPADYDVATSARPDEVRRVFGHRRTLAVGAAFGVITVLGPEGAGQIEVATFRTDAAYTDGRHPAGVTFSSAPEDARRRDFTINGLFLDPASGEVHDFVGGRADLAAGVVRAIGVPALRFGEDHLRMLRAVRFAAAFGFALDGDTRSAIERMTHLVTTVSPERIAAELRAMVSRPGRQRALELLAETGLAKEVLPEVAPGAAGTAPGAEEAWAEAARIIAALDEPELPAALAELFERAGPGALRAATARLRLSNREAKLANWLLEAVAALGGADPAGRPWSEVQPWLAQEDGHILADLLRARADCGRGDAAAAAWVTAQVARPRTELDPAPLVTGADLLAAGVASGPAMGAALAEIRALQLDGAITTRAQALARATERQS
ncbi:MAG: CCA tRNA nucleotidyltransferase [Planctomycetia bacterium]|nr:CCA tRNA nucleotidyltransferase [Planctomycetia bacterium]